METPPASLIGDKDTSQPQQRREENPQENLKSTTEIRQQPQDCPTEILELRVSSALASRVLEKPQETEKLAAGLEGDSVKSPGSTSEMPEPLPASDLWYCPDGSFVKKIIIRGHGLDKPKLGSCCRGRDSWELEASEKEALAKKERTRGTELFRAGNPEGAARCYGRALRLLLTLPPPGPPERTVLHANLAACQLLLGQPQLAAQSCDRVLEREPDHLKALYRRGVAQAALGNLDKATADLRKVLAVDPKNRAAQEELGKVIIQGKKQDAGLAQGLRKMFG
ncbi:FK506-binding protein-like isoform X2 [Canis lupus baileyi]|uniref:FK506-binding protein-like isoform X2 n=1 Tax=Canis lupus dingo TaxID=286419 RepID=UPI000DC66C9A|nr:FK506-binding protein-like isoform X2 [Canis lupus dingo]XP_038409540.1 FK506-binding protein-like isoform X2 [Canis lupus familiaris]XP_038539001.1 FK506-binding protein-like isoform X2 [Canis lupus familiaris]